MPIGKGWWSLNDLTDVLATRVDKVRSPWGRQKHVSSSKAVDAGDLLLSVIDDPHWGVQDLTRSGDVGYPRHDQVAQQVGG